MLLFCELEMLSKERKNIFLIAFFTEAAQNGPILKSVSESRKKYHDAKC